MKRFRKTLLVWGGAAASVWLAFGPVTRADKAGPARAGAQGPGRLASLRVLQGGYPRAFFFRRAEGLAASGSVPYEEWEKSFGRLMGIEGKALDEEIPGRSERNIDFFTRFKQRHPDQLVLLHYNGDARDPRDQGGKFFAGHWLYYNGATILADAPEEDGETDIRVSDPTLFRTNVGRYGNANEDVALCALDAAGRPDWRECEQVQLVSVDAARDTIRVRRGRYGTRPRAFTGGRAYAAAHVHQGPWGKDSNLLWLYNYSTRCPRDADNKSCADALAADLGGRFGAGGALASFDGIEFDVLRDRPPGGRPRGADTDGDGKADGGVFSGVNTYGAGVVAFCRQLRERLGDDRLLLADGWNERHQRAFGILNGIESEGWPALSDFEVRDWSGGLNRQSFWARNSRPPAFSYINHKYTLPGEKPGERAPDVPHNVHRLVFAAAVFTDSAITYTLAPPPEPGERVGIWDEFRMGAENKLGWLGSPQGPAVRLAAQGRDLLGGRGKPIGPDLLSRFKGDGVRFALKEGRLWVTAADPDANEMRFRLTGVPADGPDLFVSADVEAEPLRGAPAEVARVLRVGIASSPEPPSVTWVNRATFGAGYYFPDVKGREVDLEFVVEGAAPVGIGGVAAYGRPDAMYREFERGLVLANPSPRPYVFDLARLFPGRKFRRLKGSSRQDAAANNGSAVSGPLTLGPKEGLFLVKG